MESEFPSNSSRTSKEKPPASAKAEEKKVEKVVTGKVVQRKKRLSTRFKETFISGADSKSVLEYVLFDILIPAGKDMIVDATQAGLERKFYGESRSHGRRGYSRGGSGYTAYNRIGSSAARSIVRDPREDPRPAPSRRARANHDFGEIILETRVEAVAVMETLYELLSKFEVVTVADLYDAVDVESAFTDNRWGWEDLRGAEIQRVRDGYLLVLPKPIPID